MRLVPLVMVEGTMVQEALANRQKLHPTDVAALSLLMNAEAQGKALTTGELGAELRITSGATTFLVDRLERAGLVQRVRDQNDQRKIFLHFSDAGRTLADASYSPVLRMSNAVMDQFTAADLETVRRFLAATTTAMAAHRKSLGSQR